MGKKAADITRILSGWIKIGRKTIQLTETEHKAVLIALMNLLFSTVGNSDAIESADEVRSFLSDVDPVKLADYKFYLTDLVKEVEFKGSTLQALTSVWGLADVTWNVDRGGKRAVKSADKVKLSELA